MVKAYVCTPNPPYLLIINDSGNLELNLIWEALRIKYVLSSKEEVVIETPILNIRLNSDIVINKLLDFIASSKCFEAREDLGVITK